MSASIAPPPPATLPPLPAPEPGFYFGDERDAWDRASALDANALARARETLAEAYAAIAAIRDGLRRPLPGNQSHRNGPTADVLDALLRGLIDVDGESTGAALGEIDEAWAWWDTRAERMPPLFSWAGSCAPHTTMRAGDA